MSSSISDSPNAGQRMHVTCDRCHTEVVVIVPPGGIEVRKTPDELTGWRQGTGSRDLCPDCQVVSPSQGICERRGQPRRATEQHEGPAVG